MNAPEHDPSLHTAEEPLLHRLAVTADVPLNEWVRDVIGAITLPHGWQWLIISPGEDADSHGSDSLGALVEELKDKRVLGIFVSLSGSKAQIEGNKFPHVRVASAHTPGIATEALLVESANMLEIFSGISIGDQRIIVEEIVRNVAAREDGIKS